MSGRIDRPLLTSPCKGEVGREAARRGSRQRFSRTTAMTKRARHLRTNMTNAEYRLWHALRRKQVHGLQFRRQHPVGTYTLDFYCPQIGLAVEVDGGQHAEQKRLTDNHRTRWLGEKGIVVVRYWNNDVLTNLEGVLSDLVQRVESRARELTPSLTLPLSGGGNGEASVSKESGRASP